MLLLYYYIINSLRHYVFYYSIIFHSLSVVLLCCHIRILLLFCVVLNLLPLHYYIILLFCFSINILLCNSSVWLFYCSLVLFIVSSELKRWRRMASIRVLKRCVSSDITSTFSSVSSMDTALFTTIISGRAKTTTYVNCIRG